MSVDKQSRKSELLRQGVEPGYFAEREREADFICGSITLPLPVVVKMLDTLDPKDKRLAGLGLFLCRFPQVKRALVITRTAPGVVPYHDIELQAVPLWRFLLDAGRYLESS